VTVAAIETLKGCQNLHALRYWSKNARGPGSGHREPRRRRRGDSRVTERRLLTASPVRRGRRLVAGAAVVAARAASGITEGGADRHRERPRQRARREQGAIRTLIGGQVKS